MSLGTTYSKLGYLMLKEETTEAVAVFPDVGIELLSESIVTNWDTTPSNTIAGFRSMNNKSIKNRVGPATGSIEILVEPNTVGWFLEGVFGAAVTTELNADTSYQHDFEPLSALETFTMDIKPGDKDYVERYFGVVIESVSFTHNDNKATVTINVQCQKAFTNARIETDVSTGTALNIDQTSGLTTSDTILILDKDDEDTVLDTLTISSITDETNLVTSTITGTLEVDDIVVIQKQTPTYDLSNELIWSGGAQVAIANGANGIQNLSTYGNVEDVTITITNEIEPRWSATGNNVIDRFPSEMLIKGVSVEGSFTQFHRNPHFLDILRENEDTTLRFEWLGNQLDTNAAAQASAVLATNGAGTLTLTVDAAGEAGNDFAIKIVQGTQAGSATAVLTGKFVLLTLSATPTSNTISIIAAILNALTGLSTSDTGADQIQPAAKAEFTGGRDANEIEKLRIDLPNVHLSPYNANLSTDDVVNEEIPFISYRGDDGNGATEREIKVRLRNDITSY
jgi:hypothetical protein